MSKQNDIVQVIQMRLKNQIRMKKMSQEEVAGRLGISRQQLGNKLNGQDLSFSFLFSMCEILEMEIFQLLELKENTSLLVSNDPIAKYGNGENSAIEKALLFAQEEAVHLRRMNERLLLLLEKSKE